MSVEMMPPKSGPSTPKQHVLLDPAGLPNEIQLHIFSYLDIGSFFAARRVCRWWRKMSCDIVLLRQQFVKIPMQPKVSPKMLSSQVLEKLMIEASQVLMLNAKLDRSSRWEGHILSTIAFQTPRIVRTQRGSRLATIYDRTIALFDISGTVPIALTQRSICDSKYPSDYGLSVQGPPTIRDGLALSSSGTLLAIGQGQVVQIYDLAADRDSCVASVQLPFTTGESISRMWFEQDDFMLRIKLGLYGTIVYLGSPRQDSKSNRAATMEHWNSVRGLHNTFIQSPLITFVNDQPPPRPVNRSPTVEGLQILRPCQTGVLFAGLCYSRFIVGHLPFSHGPDENNSISISHTHAMCLAPLDTRETLQDLRPHPLRPVYGPDALWEVPWSHLPFGVESAPFFALNSDGTILAVAEYAVELQWVRRFSFDIYLYRITDLAEQLARIERGLAAAPLARESMVAKGKGKGSVVARVPSMLCTQCEAIQGMSFAEHGEGVVEGKEKVGFPRETTWELMVMTPEGTKVWDIVTY